MVGRRSLFLMIIFLMIVYGCVSPGKDVFDLAKDLAKSKRWEEAIGMYEEALTKDPQNSEYLEALIDAKRGLSELYIKKAESFLVNKPVTYDNARAAYQEAEKALKGEWFKL